MLRLGKIRDHNSNQKENGFSIKLTLYIVFIFHLLLNWLRESLVSFYFYNYFVIYTYIILAYLIVCRNKTTHF
jgi:hypothetical protein